MRLSIQHRTVYRYTQPVSYAIQTLYLTPKSGPTQQVEYWFVTAPGLLQPLTDAYGNSAHTLTFDQKPLMEKTLSAQGVVDTFNIAEFTETLATSPYVHLRETMLAHSNDRIASFAKQFLTAGLAQPDLKAKLLELASAVSERVSYMQGSTEVKTTAEEAFDLRSGVCQDQAHVFIAACHAAGVPARYVSGYFYAPNAPELASHAWADVCLDVAAQRWLSIDITHACVTDERHIRLAVGADYASCAPVRGVRHGGGEEVMSVEVIINPLLS